MSSSLPVTIIKLEPIGSPSKTVNSFDPLDLEQKIIELCAAFPDGISDNDLQSKIPNNIDAAQRATAINRLLTQSKIDLLKSGSILLYKLKGAEKSETTIAGATNEETLVYRAIEESQNKGIWVRDIRNVTNLPQAMLNKILKSLESRKLVKAVKSVGGARKKMYMLYELQPDSTLTGGVFYSDQEFDAQFVDFLNQQCLKYLKSKAALARDQHNDLLARRKASLTSITEMWKHIKELKVCNVELSVNDVEKILDTLVYDGTAEKEIMGSLGAFYWTKLNKNTDSCGFTKIPCTFCPVKSDCRPSSIISPATCLYFKDWLVETT